MDRTLDYERDAQMAQVQALAAHFCFFFKISEITTTVFIKNNVEK